MHYRTAARSRASSSVTGFARYTTTAGARAAASSIVTVPETWRVPRIVDLCTGEATSCSPRAEQPLVPPAGERTVCAEPPSAPRALVEGRAATARAIGARRMSATRAAAAGSTTTCDRASWVLGTRPHPAMQHTEHLIKTLNGATTRSDRPASFPRAGGRLRSVRPAPCAQRRSNFRLGGRGSCASSCGARGEPAPRGASCCHRAGGRG